MLLTHAANHYVGVQSVILDFGSSPRTQGCYPGLLHVITDLRLSSRAQGCHPRLLHVIPDSIRGPVENNTFYSM